MTLAGCGGGDGGTTEVSSAPAPEVGSQRQLDLDNAYDNALDTCSQYAPEVVAEIYGVKNQPEAIAKAVSAQETDPELREQMRKGCLAAFE